MRISRWDKGQKIVVFAVALLTIISIGVTLWKTFDTKPSHNKIMWVFKKENYKDVRGKPFQKRGVVAIKEGEIKVNLPRPLERVCGLCIVYKENGVLTLQATFPDTLIMTPFYRVGDRVIDGCSTARHRDYSLRCCWID